MKKSLCIILAILAIFIITGGVATAAGGYNSNSILILREDAPVTVLSPFAFSARATNFVPQNGMIYAGEKLSNVELTIENVGRMPYGINIFPRVVNSGPSYPSFDLRISGKAIPVNQLPILSPGEKAELTIEIFVSYGSNPAVFRGLELDIFPTPAEIPALPEKG